MKTIIEKIVISYRREFDSLAALACGDLSLKLLTSSELVGTTHSGVQGFCYSNSDSYSRDGEQIPQSDSTKSLFQSTYAPKAPHPYKYLCNEFCNKYLKRLDARKGKVRIINMFGYTGTSVSCKNPSHRFLGRRGLFIPRSIKALIKRLKTPFEPSSKEKIIYHFSKTFLDGVSIKSLLNTSKAFNHIKVTIHKPLEKQLEKIVKDLTDYYKSAPPFYQNYCFMFQAILKEIQLDEHPSYIQKAASLKCLETFQNLIEIFRSQTMNEIESSACLELMYDSIMSLASLHHQPVNESSLSNIIHQFFTQELKVPEEVPIQDALWNNSFMSVFTMVFHLAVNLKKQRSSSMQIYLDNSTYYEVSSVVDNSCRQYNDENFTIEINKEQSQYTSGVTQIKNIDIIICAPTAFVNTSLASTYTNTDISLLIQQGLEHIENPPLIVIIDTTSQAVMDIDIKDIITEFHQAINEGKLFIFMGHSLNKSFGMGLDKMELGVGLSFYNPEILSDYKTGFNQLVKAHNLPSWDPYLLSLKLYFSICGPFVHRFEQSLKDNSTLVYESLETGGILEKPFKNTLGQVWPFIVIRRNDCKNTFTYKLITIWLANMFLVRDGYGFMYTTFCTVGEELIRIYIGPHLFNKLQLHLEEFKSTIKLFEAFSPLIDSLEYDVENVSLVQTWIRQQIYFQQYNNPVIGSIRTHHLIQNYLHFEKVIAQLVLKNLPTSSFLQGHPLSPITHLPQSYSGIWIMGYSEKHLDIYCNLFKSPKCFLQIVSGKIGIPNLPIDLVRKSNDSSQEHLGNMGLFFSEDKTFGGRKYRFNLCNLTEKGAELLEMMMIKMSIIRLFIDAKCNAGLDFIKLMRLIIDELVSNPQSTTPLPERYLTVTKLASLRVKQDHSIETVIETLTERGGDNKLTDSKHNTVKVGP